MKHLVCLALLLCAASAFAAEKLTITFRYNTIADDGNNFLRWQTNDTKTADRFDAVTGASVAKSTKSLRALQEPGKKKAFPKGLYALLLFAVSPAAQAQADDLTVAKDGARLTISFMHRGNAYRITTDEKGRLHTRSSFAIAEHLADNTAGVFTIKPEFTYGAASESAAETDEAKTPAETKASAEPTQTETPKAVPTDKADAPRIDGAKLSFVPDDYDESAEMIWDGRLKTAFTDGVLTIRGTLKRIAPPKKPAPAAEPTDEGEASGESEASDRTDETFTSETEHDIIEEETAP